MRKEILSLLEKTPQKNYYTFEAEEWRFVCEVLPNKRMGFLACVNADVSDLADDLFVHHQDCLKDTYCDDHDFGVIFKRKTTKAQFEEVIDQIKAYFKSHQIHSVCCVCHQIKDLHYAHDEEAIDLICDDCFDHLTPKEYPAREFLGFAGALVLCVIPALIWAYLHDFGYLISLAGLLFAYCSFKGFLILGENMNREGLIMCVIAAVIDLFGGQVLAFGLEVQAVFKTNFKASITLSQAMSAVPGFIDREVLSVTLTYFLLCLLFMVIGYVLLVRHYKKKHFHRMTFNSLENDLPNEKK